MKNKEKIKKFFFDSCKCCFKRNISQNTEIVDRRLDYVINTSSVELNEDRRSNNSSATSSHHPCVQRENINRVSRTSEKESAIVAPPSPPKTPPPPSYEEVVNSNKYALAK